MKQLVLQFNSDLRVLKNRHRFGSNSISFGYPQAQSDADYKGYCPFRSHIYNQSVFIIKFYHY